MKILCPHLYMADRSNPLILATNEGPVIQGYIQEFHGSGIDDQKMGEECMAIKYVSV